MKSIHTLTQDVQELLTQKDWVTDDLASEFADAVARRLVVRFRTSDRRPGLRLSGLGPRCPRALWYSIHHPECSERMPAWAENKFTFGDIIEAWAITLAKAAGHTVEGEQDELSVDGIVGHRDCVIDGCVVDVKSASSRSFTKFKDGSIKTDDPFGYLSQLDGYVVGSLDDPIVTVKDKGYLWAIDKQLGHMCTYEHTIDASGIHRRVDECKRIVASSTVPECTCGTVPEGKSGNQRLDVRASYSSYKHCCFPHLRTFLYASGPVYLAKVERKPDVTEIDRHGNIVYS